jgi:hypothetical protein
MHIVENWSRLTGTVASWQAPAAPDEPGILTLRVERVRDVPSGRGAYRNLLEAIEGQTVRIRVPHDAAKDLTIETGGTIELDVRRGRSADQLFAHPDRIKS